MNKVSFLSAILFVVICGACTPDSEVQKTKNKYLQEQIRFFSKNVEVARDENGIYLNTLPAGSLPWEFRQEDRRFEKSDRHLQVGDLFYWGIDNYDRTVYEIVSIENQGARIRYTQSTRGTTDSDYIDEGLFTVHFVDQ